MLGAVPDEIPCTRAGIHASWSVTSGAERLPAMLCIYVQSLQFTSYAYREICGKHRSVSCRRISEQQKSRTPPWGILRA